MVAVRMQLTPSMPLSDYKHFSKSVNFHGEVVERKFVIEVLV